MLKPTELLLMLVLVLFIHTSCALKQKKVITLPATGVPDPHLRIIDGKFWLFAGRDVAPTVPDWVMPNWDIYSSDDLVSWTLETSIGPKDNYMPDDSDQCWAPDAISRHGHTYFYFSNHNKTTGVMRADSPAGPYVDVLGKPLLPESLTPGKEFDPTVFIDDDAAQTPYIIFGYKGRGGYYIAKLNDDMISLAEKPKLIEIVNDDGRSIDKNYLHKFGDTYYLSSGGYYATSKSVYGPYMYRGITGEGHGLGVYSHGSFMAYRGQWYHIWTRYLNRDISRYRESFMTYAHYRENGELVTDTRYLDRHKAWGVGRFDAAWKMIEAEWFYASERATKRDDPNDPNNFYVSIVHGTVLYFPKMHRLKHGASLKLVGPVTSDGVKLEIYAGKASNRLLAQCNLLSGAVNACAIKSTPANVEDIELRFSGEIRSHDSEPLLMLDQIRFE